MNQIDAATAAYLDELAADMAEHRAKDDPVQDIRDAQERRQAFALEMAEDITNRARKARELILTAIYHHMRAR